MYSPSAHWSARSMKATGGYTGVLAASADQVKWKVLSRGLVLCCLLRRRWLVTCGRTCGGLAGVHQGHPCHCRHDAGSWESSAHFAASADCSKFKAQRAELHRKDVSTVPS